MRFPSKEEIERIKKQYPVGSHVELLGMDDPMPVPAGTIGEILGVDDAGDLLVRWSNGSSLKLIVAVDSFRKVADHNKICPRCGNPYTGVPALSRRDNTTPICPDCGYRESMEAAGMGKELQDEVLAAIHSFDRDQQK